jgi:AhpD family alkylhydroperoxidase
MSKQFFIALPLDISPMNTPRLPYYKLSPEAMQGFLNIKSSLENSSLGLPLIELVYLRISQINGCSYCVGLHTKALLEKAETAQRLDALTNWRISNLFTEKERAALEWAESLTDIVATHASDAAYLRVVAN